MFPIQDNNIKGYIYAVASSFLVGLGFVINKIILREVNPETASVYFFGFGTLGSFLILGARRELGKLKSFKIYWKPMIALGFLGGAGALMVFYAIDLIGPSIVSFLLRFLTIFVLLWSFLFLKEKLNKIEVLGMVIAIMGVFIVTYTSENFLVLSAAMVLAAALLFSIFQLIIKLNVKKITPLVINHFRINLMFLVLLLYSLLTSKLQTPTPTVLILAPLSGVFVGVIGISLFFKALEIAELSKVNIIRTMDPFVVVLYAFLILHEVPSPNQLLGGVIIVGGISLLTIARYQPKIIARWTS